MRDRRQHFLKSGRHRTLRYIDQPGRAADRSAPNSCMPAPSCRFTTFAWPAVVHSTRKRTAADTGCFRPSTAAIRTVKASESGAPSFLRPAATVSGSSYEWVCRAADSSQRPSLAAKPSVSMHAKWGRACCTCSSYGPDSLLNPEGFSLRCGTPRSADAEDAVLRRTGTAEIDRILDVLIGDAPILILRNLQPLPNPPSFGSDTVSEG